MLDCSQQGGCGNGSLLGALNFLVANGTVTLASYGNNHIFSGAANSTNCSGITVKVNTFLYVNKWFKISSGKLKKIVAQGPTANEIYVDSNFSNYNGVEWPYKCKANVKNEIQLNHALVVSGYDKHSNFILRNSKGTGWGKNGYMLIKKNKDCGLRKRVFQLSTVKNTSANGYWLSSMKMAATVLLITASSITMF